MKDMKNFKADKPLSRGAKLKLGFQLIAEAIGFLVTFLMVLGLLFIAPTSEASEGGTVASGVCSVIDIDTPEDIEGCLYWE